MGDDKQYTVPPNTDAEKIKAQLTSFMRDAVIVAGVLSALLKILSTHNWAELIVFVQGDTFLTAAAMIAGVGTFLYRQWLTRRTLKVAALAADPATTDQVTVKDT